MNESTYESTYTSMLGLGPGSLPSVIPTVMLILAGTALLALWMSPSGCAWVAAVLRARGAAKKAADQVYKEMYETMRPRRGYDPDLIRSVTGSDSLFIQDSLNDLDEL